MDKDKIIALWEQHLGAELFAKDVDATMATMTSDPYVNHVPTMTGGVGSSELRRFIHSPLDTLRDVPGLIRFVWQY
jgi:carboxymethylenebutenolidase